MSAADNAARVHAMSVAELLALHANILDELRERDIVRSANGPAGDYAELLFARALSWTRTNNSAAGHDATDAAGVRYQVKSRRLTPRNPSRRLSFIRRLPEKHFDQLAGVLFNADFTVYRAALVPHMLLESRSRFSKHVNGWVFGLDDAVWTLSGVHDVTSELRAAAGLL